MQGFIPPFALLQVGLALSAVGEVIVWTFSSQLLLSLAPVHLRDHILSLDFLIFNLIGVLGVGIPEVMVERLDLGIMGAYMVLAGSFVVPRTAMGNVVQTGEIPLCSGPSATGSPVMYWAGGSKRLISPLATPTWGRSWRRCPEGEASPKLGAVPEPAVCYARLHAL